MKSSLFIVFMFLLCPVVRSLKSTGTDITKWLVPSKAHRALFKMLPKYSSCRRKSMLACCITIHTDSFVAQRSLYLARKWWDWKSLPDPKPYAEPSIEVNPADVEVTVQAVKIVVKLEGSTIWIMFRCVDTRSETDLQKMHEERESRIFWVECQYPEIPQDVLSLSSFHPTLGALMIKYKIEGTWVPDKRCIHPRDLDNDADHAKVGMKRKPTASATESSSSSRERSKTSETASSSEQPEEAQAASSSAVPVQIRPFEHECVDYDPPTVQFGHVALAEVQVQRPRHTKIY